MRDTNVIALPVAWRMRLSQWAVTSALVVAMGGLGVNLAHGQHAQGGPAGNPFGGGMQRPGGQPFGGPPAAGGNKKGANPKDLVPPVLKPAVELKIDPVKLPDDFVPPMDKDPRLTEEKPIALPDEMAKLKKEDGKFNTVLNRALRDDASKAIIRDGIRYRLAQMTLPENHKKDTLSKLYDLRVKLRDLLNGAGSAAKELKPAELLEFRRFIMAEFVKQATPLLDNNLYVRLQITILLGELELVQGVTGKVQAEAFTPAFDPLVKAIADEKQPESVKVLAVNGLTRILKIGTPNVNERTKIAEAIIAELSNTKRPNTKSHPWYQMRLVGALGFAALDQLKQPIIVTALKDVMGDSTRSWAVRTEAAKSLGRTPIPPAANPPSVILAIAKMTAELTKEAQAKPKDPQWKGAFWKAYLAFVPADATDVDATKANKAGLNNNAAISAAAKPVYNLIVPLVRAVLSGQALNATDVQALDAWIKSNTPANPPAGNTSG